MLQIYMLEEQADDDDLTFLVYNEFIRYKYIFVIKSIKQLKSIFEKIGRAFR